MVRFSRGRLVVLRMCYPQGIASVPYRHNMGVTPGNCKRLVKDQGPPPLNSVECGFFGLRALHTTRGPDRVHHRLTGDVVGHHTPARPRARLSRTAPRRPEQTRPTRPLPLGLLSSLCSPGLAAPGYAGRGEPAAG